MACCVVDSYLLFPDKRSEGGLYRQGKESEKEIDFSKHKILVPQTTSFTRYAIVFKIRFLFPLSFQSIYGKIKEISRVFVRLLDTKVKKTDGLGWLRSRLTKARFIQ